MELTIKTDAEGFVDAYLRIWNGGVKMTEKELTIMKDILLRFSEMTKSGITEPYLSELLFSANTLKDIRDKHKLSSASWYLMKKSLMKKKVLVGEDRLQVNPKLVPQQKLIFNFVIDE